MGLKDHDWEAVREALEAYMDYLSKHEPYATRTIAEFEKVCSGLPDPEDMELQDGD